MNITLKYKHVDFIFKLLNIPLHGQERRDRDHFSKYLITKAEETESFRIRLLKDLSNKNEKNEPKMKPDNSFDISPVNEDKFKKEMLEYLDSDMIVDILDSNKKELNTIKNLLDNTREPLNFHESEMLNEIINAFDKKEEKKNEEKTEEVKTEKEIEKTEATQTTELKDPEIKE